MPENLQHVSLEDDTQQEVQLREMYRRYAPKSVNIEHAWHIVSRELQQSAQHMPLSTPSRRTRPTFLHRRVLLIAAAAVLSLVIMAAGFAASGILNIYHGTEKALAIQEVLTNPAIYTKIDQTQQNGKNTVTIDRAYSDASTAIIVYNQKWDASQPRDSQFSEPHSLQINGQTVPVEGVACNPQTRNEERCTLVTQGGIPEGQVSGSDVTIQFTFGVWDASQSQNPQVKDNPENISFTLQVRYHKGNSVKTLPNNNDSWIVP